MDIILGKERRRWSEDVKRAIVADTIATGEVTAVARRHGCAPSMVFAWRKQFGAPACGERTPSLRAAGRSDAGAAQDFALVTLTGSSARAAPGEIEIEFGADIRLRISGAVDPSLASAIAKALTLGVAKR